jgi:hypothetical protein
MGIGDPVTSVSRSDFAAVFADRFSEAWARLTSVGRGVGPNTSPNVMVRQVIDSLLLPIATDDGSIERVARFVDALLNSNDEVLSEAARMEFGEAWSVYPAQVRDAATGALAPAAHSRSLGWRRRRGRGGGSAEGERTWRRAARRRGLAPRRDDRCSSAT